MSSGLSMTSLKLINPFNRPLHVGLAITEEKGLDDAEKLQVPYPADHLKSKGPLAVTVGFASDSNRQALIALLVAHRVATVLKISGKDFKSHLASERHNAFLVTAAHSMCVHGLIGFHSQVDLSHPRSKKATYCTAGGFVSEKDLNGDDKAQAQDPIFTKEVACDVKLRLSTRASG